MEDKKCHDPYTIIFMMHRLYFPWPGAKEICHVAKRKEICHGAYSKNNAMIRKIHLSCSMKVNCHGPNVAEVSSSVLFLCLNRQQTFYSCSVVVCSFRVPNHI